MLFKIKAFFKDMAGMGTSLGGSYKRSIFFWNPVICLAFELFFLGHEHFLRDWLTSVFISTLVSSFCFGTVRSVALLEQFLAYRNKRTPVKRSIGSRFAISTTAMPLGLFLAFKITALVFTKLGIPWTAPDLTDYRFGITLGSVIALLFFLIRSRFEAREATRTAELKVQRLENDHLRAQLSALTAQMNPHLLFNALNTVASLVPTDPRKAEETILRLSELYRGVLDSSRNMTHSLATEMDICRAYLAVEQARFGSRLDVSIEISGDIEQHKVQIPSLSLQPLVENAVKHGVASLAAGGSVAISVRTESGALMVSIEDNGVGFGNSTKKGAGTGLANCRERLRLNYGEAAKVEASNRVDGGAKILLSMPVVLQGLGLQETPQ